MPGSAYTWVWSSQAVVGAVPSPQSIVWDPNATYVGMVTDSFAVVVRHVVTNGSSFAWTSENAGAAMTTDSVMATAHNSWCLRRPGRLSTCLRSCNGIKLFQDCTSVNSRGPYISRRPLRTCSCPAPATRGRTRQNLPGSSWPGGRPWFAWLTTRGRQSATGPEVRLYWPS